MRHGVQSATRFAVLAALSLLAACGSVGSLFGKGADTHPEPVVSHPTADGEAARDYLASLQALVTSSPANQAEIFESAREEALNAPTTVSRLRYTLMLAMPGHPGTDPVAARRQLSEILARPELLLPSERALATTLLASVDDRLVLDAEARRLEADASAHDKDRSAQLQKRLQAEVEENARLKRALEDAQKKLDAVTEVERSITGRGNPPKP